jgi:peptidyl-prolyl cis-trans isomerase A (cyclophilin A)
VAIDPEAARIRALVTPDSAALAAAAPDSFAVIIETSAGEVELLLHRDWSPLGVDRFHWLSVNDFFRGARFYRVLPGFVAQFGFTGIPEVDAVWETRSIPDEPARVGNRRGTLVFATGGPNTRATQLFFNLADNRMQLDGLGFAPIGEVVRGLDVIERLYAEYGEGAPYGTGPAQGRIIQEGNAYLRTRYPALDSIARTTVVPR